MSSPKTIFVACIWMWTSLSIAKAETPRNPLPSFERIVIDNNLPGGYQVEVADVNGDKHPDIIALGGGTCAWYENPKWTKRIVSGPERTPGIISSATADLNGDGKAEIMIAYEFSLDAPKKGKLALATQAKDGGDAWTLTPIADIGSIHRLRFGDFDGDGRRVELAVAPIVGPTAAAPSYNQSSASLLVFQPSRDGQGWVSEVVVERPLIHAIDVIKRPGGDQILSADNLGIASHFRINGSNGWQHTSLTSGAEGEPPKRGCSEIHKGQVKIDGKTAEFLATVEPWHGTQVAIGFDDGESRFTKRTIIDREIGEGHALWVADVDGDGDDEIFAGDRGPATRVTAYDFDGERWVRTILDSQVAAQDLRGDDLDGDGRPDFVAVGGKTHNVVWYRPQSTPHRPSEKR